MRYITWFELVIGLLIWLTGSGSGFSQDLTTRDNEEVKLLARRKIEMGLNDLLNVLSLSDIGEAERNALITQSFTPGVNQLFADKDVVVEDDINPNRATTANVLDMQVEKYLANFDLLYTKSTQSSIAFSDITVTDLKKTSTLYVKVFYSELFKGKHTQIEVPYKLVRRVAEIKAERTGSKWSVLITRLAFFAYTDSINVALNNVALKDVPLRRLTALADTMASTSGDSTQLVTVTAMSVDPEAEQEKQVLLSYQKLLKDGDAALASGDLETAQQLYEQAEKQKPFEDLTPRVKLFRVQKVLEERSLNSVSEMKKRFGLALQKRRYSEALILAQRIADLKPDSTALTEQIKDLVSKARRKTELDDRFTAGQYRELLKEYSRLIDAERKQNKTALSKINSSDWYLGRGKCSTQLGDYKDALRDLNESLNLDFQNLDALESRAELFARMNDFPKAVADLSIFLTADPANAELLARRATYRIKTNRTVEAFADYDEAIRISNQNPRYFALRGLLHQKMGACDRAETDFTEGINRSRRQPELYFQRGLVHVCLQQYTVAGTDFARAIELGLNAVDLARIDSVAATFYAQSEQNLQAGKHPEALALLSTALLLKPTYGNAWLAKGKIHSSLRDEAKADTALTNAIRYNPADANAFYLRGLTRTHLGVYADAVTDFGQAASLQPTHYDAVLGEAKARIQLRQYDKAQTILSRLRNVRKQLEKRYPPAFFADTYFLSGKCAYELRDYEQALEQFDNVLNLTRDWAALYILRGRTYEALNKIERARDDYEKAAQLEPTVAAHYIPIGLLLEKKGKFEDALHGYTRSEELDHDHELTNLIAVRKGRCLMELGKYLDALSELNKVGQYDGVSCTDECLYLRTYTQVRTGQLPASVRLSNLTTSTASPENAPKIRYVLACGHLQAKDENQALAQLEKALQMGLSKEFLKKDKLLDFVWKDFRKTGAYTQLINRYK